LQFEMLPDMGSCLVHGMQPYSTCNLLFILFITIDK
jgi:hypothetical protein